MIACGKRIPDSEHAVSVSLPTMRDVTGYEEQDPAVLRAICSGYPRFVCHWMVKQVQDMLGPGVVALHDRTAVDLFRSQLRVDVEVLEDLPFGAVRLSEEQQQCLGEPVRRFLQHTGLQLSSRAAEDFLIARGVRGCDERDHVNPIADAEGGIKRVLSDAYGTCVEQIDLFSSGMAAVYAVHRAIHRKQRQSGRKIWLQVGWLYLDTSALLERFIGETVVFGVHALDEVEAYLARNHGKVAGVTTEIMTNPLLQTTDIVRLSRLCRQYAIPLIIDTSMPTPINVDVLALADVVVESLTKFASGHADVMAGAAVYRPDSEWASAIRSDVCASPPYVRDAWVLAAHIRGYRERMQQINARTRILGDYFRGHPCVQRVYDAGQGCSRESYDRIRRADGGYGGVLSVVFKVPLEQIYDTVRLCKGPSFGTVFTLCMPYVYLAHYDLVSTAAGRRTLHAHGVDPELLRISVGLEPVEDIIAAFEVVMPRAW
ncbi:MAG: PLP-dependent transferase [Kiritimatiellia bacterium]